MRRLRPRRNRTTILNAVYDTEVVYVCTMAVGSTQFTGQTTRVVSILSADVGGQAANYGFLFNLRVAYQAVPSYQTIQSLYDWYKLKKVQLTLKSNVAPKSMMTIALGADSTATYNLQGALNYDPDMTIIDYNGITLNSPLPTNGDATQIIYNRTGIRKHKAFGTIRRTFYPRTINLLATAGAANGAVSSASLYPNVGIYNTVSGQTTNIAGVGASFQKGKRYGWCSNSQDLTFTGCLGLFTSYKGPNAPGAGNQPAYSWAVSSKWFIAYRDTIYG